MWLHGRSTKTFALLPDDVGKEFWKLWESNIELYGSNVEGK